MDNFDDLLLADSQAEIDRLKLVIDSLKHDLDSMGNQSDLDMDRIINSGLENDRLQRENQELRDLYNKLLGESSQRDIFPSDIPSVIKGEIGSFVSPIGSVEKRKREIRRRR